MTKQEILHLLEVRRDELKELIENNTRKSGYILTHSLLFTIKLIKRIKQGY